MQMTDASYERAAISNGHPQEQALIRRWWQEDQGGHGRLVWEYYLGDCYLDAMLFPDAIDDVGEHPGTAGPSRFPIAGQRVVLCEAKLKLTPELIGQALTYSVFAKRAGALVSDTVIFARSGRLAFVSAAQELGLRVVVAGSPVSPAA
jgi:hypothetical protein